MATSLQLEMPPAASSVDPVTIQLVREHGYRSRGKGKNGCSVKLEDGRTMCMRAKTHECHVGLPMSLNEFRRAAGWHAYQGLKRMWEDLIIAQLDASGLPHGWPRTIRELVEQEDEKTGKIKQVEVSRLIDPEPGTVKISSALVESEVCFPIRPDQGRDQGNFRWFIEKCVGDALQLGGYLEDDTYWPVRRYEHGGLEMRYEKGIASTCMTLMPDLGLRGDG